MYLHCLNRMLALAEPAYRDFSASLLPGVGNLLGVRLPHLRRLAREILRGDWRKWLAEAERAEARGEEPGRRAPASGGEVPGPDGAVLGPAGGGVWFEERMLRGMVIAGARCAIDEKLEYVRRFLPAIDNWAVCDSFCWRLQEREREAVWRFIGFCFDSGDPYTVRFAAVMGLVNFTDAGHLGALLEQLGRVRSGHYYVRMGVAWAVSVCFAADPERVVRWLGASCPLDDWTYDRALQKIIESRRTDETARATCRAMKRRTKNCARQRKYAK